MKKAGISVAAGSAPEASNAIPSKRIRRAANESPSETRRELETAGDWRKNSLRKLLERMQNNSTDKEVEEQPSGKLLEDLPGSTTVKMDLNSAKKNSKFLEFLKSYGNRSNYQVKNNASEIIFMALSLAISQNWTETVTVQFFGFLNMLLDTCIFPETEEKFQQLFSPSAASMQLHSVCKGCGTYLWPKTEDKQVMMCPSCKVENDVNGKLDDYTFLTLDLESQVRDFLQANITTIISQANCSSDESDMPQKCTYDDIQKGSSCQKLAPGIDFLNCKIYLTCNLNVDDVTVHDSELSFTPIHLMINEIEVSKRGKTTLLAGLWYGKEKPKINAFLLPFAHEMKKLSTVGMKYYHKGTELTVFLLPTCFCVNSETQSKVQGISHEEGRHCCSWCEIEAVLGPLGKMSYPSIEISKSRTDEAFQNDCKKLVDRDQNHGMKLLNPIFALDRFAKVWGIVPDYSSSILLGVVNRFVELWMSDASKDKDYYIGNQAKALENMQGKIRPHEFVKIVPPAASFKAFVKAREAENWMLFYSVAILKVILPKLYYEHWLLLVGAVQLLIQDEITSDEIETAECYLKLFVHETEALYGQTECTSNVHQLLHFAESVRRWGPVWAHTTFPFDEANRNMSNVLQAFTDPHQVVRRWDLIRFVNVTGDSIEVKEHVNNYVKVITESNSQHFAFCAKNKDVIVCTPEKGPLRCGSDKEKRMSKCDKIIIQNRVYEKCYTSQSEKFDNSYVVLKNGEFARIIEIFQDCESKNLTMLVQALTTVPQFPLKSTMKVLTSYGNSKKVEFSDIQGPAVMAELDFNTFITAIPQKHFVLNS